MCTTIQSDGKMFSLVATEDKMKTRTYNVYENGWLIGTMVLTNDAVKKMEANGIVLKTVA